MKATIHFIIRADRPAKDGSAPIYLVFLIDRNHRTKISIGKNAPLKNQYRNMTINDLINVPLKERKKYYCWDENAERVTPQKDPVNIELDKKKAQAIAVIEKLELMGRPLTIDLFLNNFSRPRGNFNLADYFEKEVLEKRKNLMASDTYRSYKATISKVCKFRPNLTLSAIDYKFLCEFEDYMLKPVSKHGLGNIPNTVAKTMRVLRTLILVAIKNGDLHKDNYPFRDYTIKQPDPVLTTRDYLEPDDFFKLAQLLSPEKISCLTPGEIKATKRFLYACCTGLRYSDVNKLHWQKHIFSKYVFNPSTKLMTFRSYIELTMTKTAQPIFIPLIDMAMELMGEKKDNLVFEKISNQKLNAHLKEIAKKAELDKKLTFHVARHSFATICFLYDIPLEVGQKLLGHRNRKFTEIYTHLSKNRLFYEMDKLNRGLSDYALIAEETDSQQQNLKEMIPILQNMSPEKLEQLKSIAKLLDK